MARNVLSPQICTADIRIQVGYPLLTLLGDLKVTQSILNIRMHVIPVEFNVVDAKVLRGFVSKLLSESKLLKFVKQEQINLYMMVPLVI